MLDLYAQGAQLLGNNTVVGIKVKIQVSIFIFAVGFVCVEREPVGAGHVVAVVSSENS